MKQLSAISLILLASASHAQEWLDVTDLFITNPNYDGTSRITQTISSLPKACT